MTVVGQEPAPASITNAGQEPLMMKAIVGAPGAPFSTPPPLSDQVTWAFSVIVKRYQSVSRVPPSAQLFPQIVTDSPTAIVPSSL